MEFGNTRQKGFMHGQLINRSIRRSSGLLERLAFPDNSSNNLPFVEQFPRKLVLIFESSASWKMLRNSGWNRKVLAAISHNIVHETMV
jgi:hypothetical protein